MAHPYFFPACQVIAAGSLEPIFFFLGGGGGL